MTEITNKQWSAMSDSALMKTIGSFIKHHRLEQNKTQAQLAAEAGINRATLSLFENGVNSNLMTFIQLLRVLKLLHLLQEFQVKQQISPLQLARLEHSKRIRARRTGSDEKKSTPKSDW
ncbi:MAG: helix-turn-helix transcriptional regulator [Bacteroidetes bacterium]|nr:helix-turn-helix transcriptional regulator [Bacteroidota bacterium]